MTARLVAKREATRPLIASGAAAPSPTSSRNLLLWSGPEGSTKLPSVTPKAMARAKSSFRVTLRLSPSMALTVERLHE